MAAQSSLEYLVVINDELPISDVLEVPIGTNHIRPDQVNKEAFKAT